MLPYKINFSFQSDANAQEQSEAPASRNHIPISATPPPDISPEKRSVIISNLKSIQIPFISNQGQMHKDVRFYAKTFGGMLFVTGDGGLVYSLPKVDKDGDSSSSIGPAPSPLAGDDRSPSPLTGENHNPLSSLVGGSTTNPPSSLVGDTKSPFPFVGVEPTGRGVGKEQTLSIAIKEELIGAKVREIKGERESATKVSYFKGNDLSMWKSGIPPYESVSLGEVYEGIELKFKAYGNNVEKLFYVNPAADPGDIRLKLNGIKGMKVNKEGELEVETELGTVKFTRPVAYQEKPLLSLMGGHPNSPSPLAGEGRGGGDGEREKEFVEVAYVVDGANYSFKVGEYDKTRPLIIDPLLASTFIGGSKGDYVQSLAIDGSGAVYVAGITNSFDYPTTPGAYDTSFNGGDSDVLISRLSGDLSTLLASTFIGGSRSDFVSGITTDASGAVYVWGSTNSSDYPTLPGGYDTSYNGNYDVFVSRLSSDLSTLLASTFIGGSSSDYAESLAIDGSGTVYVAGRTDSSDYPTTSGAYDTSYNSDLLLDVFVSQLSSDLSTLLASTFIGGSSGDIAFSLAIDGSGAVYVAGWTSSSDYPTMPGAYDRSYNGRGDVFVSRLSSDLSRLLASTFIRGDGNDEAHTLAIDGSGAVYVAGWTSSSDYPTMPGAYNTSFNGSGSHDVFISRLSSDLSTLLASTFIGGSGTDIAFSLAIDGSGAVYVGGRTYSSDYPTTPGAYDTSFNGSNDVFISRLSSDLSTLLASTFIGGSGSDFALSLAIDGAGAVYVGGFTDSSDYPTTPGAYDTSYSGGYYTSDAFVSKLDENLSSPGTLPDLFVLDITTNPSKPSPGQNVNVTVTVKNQGYVSAGAFFVDFYKDLATAPLPGQSGDIYCSFSSLAVGATVTCNGTVSYVNEGTYDMRAQVDTDQEVTESDENNNVFGPQTLYVKLDTVGVCVSPPANLVSWWPGDGSSEDIIGGNHGVFVNGATFLPGMVEQAFSFDRSIRYVEVPHHQSLNLTNAVSVSAWIYHRSNGYADPIVTKGGEGLGQYDGFSLEFGGAERDSVFFWVYLDGGQGWRNSGGVVVPNYQWTHVTGTYDGSTIKLYINGALASSSAVTGNIIPSSNTLRIGGFTANPSRTFDGLIDEVEIYNRALSAPEIQAIFNAGSAGKCKIGTLAELPRTGQTTCYNSAGDVISCAGTGQDGEIQAGVAWPDPRFTDNGDGTVADNLTGLMWTKDANAPGPAACSPATTKTWQKALDYVACLNTNAYLGYADWHLPNVNEIESLIDAETADRATWLNTQGFSNVQPNNYYWSSTTRVSLPHEAWLVNILNGYLPFSDKSNY